MLWTEALYASIDTSSSRPKRVCEFLGNPRSAWQQHFVTRSALASLIAVQRHETREAIVTCRWGCTFFPRVVYTLGYILSFRELSTLPPTPSRVSIAIVETINQGHRYHSTLLELSRRTRSMSSILSPKFSRATNTFAESFRCSRDSWRQLSILSDIGVIVTITLAEHYRCL